MMPFIAVLVAACVAGTTAYSTNIQTGYIVVSAQYGLTDLNCGYDSLTTASYYNVGACVPTGASASVLYSTDSQGTIYVDTWSNSATCAGIANVGANVPVTSTPCLPSGGIYTKTYFYVTSLNPYIFGNYQNQLYYQTSACSSTYGGIITPTNVISTSNTLNGCTSNQQCTATTYSWGKGFSIVQCVAATAASPLTTLLSAGNIIYAQNYAYGCLPASVPSVVQQFPPSTCTPYAAGVQFQVQSNSGFAYTQAQSSQHLAFTYKGTTYISFVAYTGPGCTGAVIVIENFASSSTVCTAGFYNQISTGFSNGQQLVYYSATAKGNTLLPANSIYSVTQYYQTYSGCQGGDQTSPLQWTQYQFPGYQYNQYTACNALQYQGTTYIAPYTASYNVMCTATPAQSNFVTMMFYSDQQCNNPTTFVNGYQLGVCTITGASTSYTLSVSKNAATGVTTVTTNTYPTVSCTGTPTATTFATSNCMASTINPGYYQQITVGTTLGVAQANTANAPTPLANSVTWVVGFNDQAACKKAIDSTTVSYMEFFLGSVATCTPYIVGSPTTTVNNGVVNTQIVTPSYASATVNGCSPPTPTATPSAAPVNPTPKPSSSPLNQVYASTNSVSCFAGTELVTLEDGASKAISEVAMGDRILTVNARGEQVYSDVAYLPHGKNVVQAVFTVVSTETGRDLKMTANHMLPAGACTAASLPVVAAGQVAVGECVQTVSGRERVVSVSAVEGKGIYTVIAMEELIVVNGVVATPYGGVNPALANVYYNVHRLAYKVAGKAVLMVQGATEGMWRALSLLAASH